MCQIAKWNSNAQINQKQKVAQCSKGKAAIYPTKNKEYEDVPHSTLWMYIKN